MKSTNDAYGDLSNAIILQAVEDYRRVSKALRKSKIGTKSLESLLETKKEIEKFFLGKWFQTITDVNGEFLLKKLQQE